MFNIGDKIVYPMHGAGTIDSIEEKDILGEKIKDTDVWRDNDDVLIEIDVEVTYSWWQWLIIIFLFGWIWY